MEKENKRLPYKKCTQGDSYIFLTERLRTEVCENTYRRCARYNSITGHYELRSDLNYRFGVFLAEDENMHNCTSGKDFSLSLSTELN